MDKQIADQWVAALRSGKYKQGKYELHNVAENKWCCLGVLCDLVSGKTTIGRSVLGNLESFNGETAFLPYEVHKTINSKTSNSGKLMHLNDSGVPFNEIADYIEANWENI